MDSEIAWEECVDDIPIDTKNLPSLNALSSNSTHLPDIDLLDLFSFDHNNPQNVHHQSNLTENTRSPKIRIPITNTSTTPANVPQQPDHNTISIPSHVLQITDSPVTSPSSPRAASSTESGRNSSNCSESSDIHQKQQSSPSYIPKNTNTNAKEITDQSQLVLELSTRLASAGAEATALRKRVASLSAENRSLRAALDHANARLLAVAQAATATTQPSTTQPVMLGLAHVTTDVANRLAGALTVSDPNAIPTTTTTPSTTTTTTSTELTNSNDNSYSSYIENQYITHQQYEQQNYSPPRNNKKRKRVSGAAATTMACVMFMWGALVGSPGWLSSSGNSTSRTQVALPAIWNGEETQQQQYTAVANVNSKAVNEGKQKKEESSWQPNCMRTLEQLPDGKESNKKLKTEPSLVIGGGGNGVEREKNEDDDENMMENEMFVNVIDSKRNAKVIATADHYSDNKLPKYSYVLCRDTQRALENVKACTKRMKNGLTCGEPHTISLILPASATGLEELIENEPGSGDSSTSSADSKNGRANDLQLAEVQCSITSVAKIPVGNVEHNQNASVKGQSNEQRNVDRNEQAGARGTSKFGRVIATVPETGTVVIG